MGSRSCSVPKLIIEELNQTDEVVDSAKRACQQLSAAAGPSSHNVCTSWLEAFATIQKREDDRRKSSKQEAKSKQKKTSNEQMQFRGTRIGVDPEVSAFWMVMEVLLQPELEIVVNLHDFCPLFCPVAVYLRCCKSVPTSFVTCRTTAALSNQETCSYCYHSTNPL